MDDKALSVQDVAKYLKVSTKTVYGLINDGVLPAFKVGNSLRMLSSDLESYVKQQKKGFDSSTLPPSDVGSRDLTVRSLNLKIDEFQLKDITFTLPGGTILALLGSSGSGKTSLLKGIAGLEPLKSGAVFVGRERMDVLSIHDRRLGFVFQDYALFPHLDSRRNLGFALSMTIKKLLGEEAYKRQLNSIIEELKIPAEYLPKMPDALPEGIKQLVAIGREKSHAVDLYLMDEPMSQMDRDIRSHMRLFIQKILRDMGKTTVIVLNDPEDALALSDYTAIIENGRLLQFGETQTVFEQPLTSTVMELFSPLGVNKIRMKVENGRTVPGNLSADQPDGEYWGYFRPDSVSDSKSVFTGTVLKRQFFDGKRQLVDIKLDNEEKTIATILTRQLDKDEIGFTPEAVCYFPFRDAE